MLELDRHGFSRRRSPSPTTGSRWDARHLGVARARDVTAAGQTFAVVRRGSSRATSGSSRAAPILATAAKPSVFGREFVVTFGWTLRLRRVRRGAALTLLEREREVGDVGARDLVPRARRAPDTLPLSVRFFVLWLPMLIWRRDDDAAAATV